MELRKKTSKKKDLLEILELAASTSTVHGLPKIITETSTLLKVYWSAFFMLTFIGALTHLSLMVKAYYTHPVAEISSSKEGIPIEFPSVTICNINAIPNDKFDRLLRTDVRKEILDWFTFIMEFQNGSFATQLGTQQAFYENLPHIASQIGQRIDDFVLFCNFNNMDCGPDNFSVFFDSTNYYNCFTFNSGYNRINITLNNEKLLARKTGVLNGLSLILSLNNESPLPGVYGRYDKGKITRYSAGARVQIHPSGTMSSPVNKGFDVPPGFSTNVGVEAVKYSRLRQPHGDCTFEKLEVTREYRNAVSTCLQICKQNILQVTCGCNSSEFLLLHENDILNDSTYYCDSIKEFQNLILANKTDMNSYIRAIECKNNVLNDFQENGVDEKACGCFQPCTELAYKTTISTSLWPLEFYQYHLLNDFYNNGKIQSGQLKEALDLLNATMNKHIDNISLGQFENYSQSDMNNQMRASAIIRENLISLNIYVDNLRTTEFKTVPTYDVFDLLADIGGTLGLWLGISFLTIMELVEVKIKLVSYFLKSKHAKSKEDKNVDSYNQEL